MKIFLLPPNFCSFPDFVLEESVWHAINLWGHWKACSFTRDQNHSSNHSGVIKNFIFIKWHYIQVQFNPFHSLFIIIQIMLSFTVSFNLKSYKVYLSLFESLTKEGKSKTCWFIIIVFYLHSFISHTQLKSENVKRKWMRRRQKFFKSCFSNCAWMPDETTSP